MFSAWAGKDHPTQLPIDMPRVGMEWADPKNWKLENDTEWGSMFETDGFSQVGPDGRTFQISMVHQLHCLDVIRVGFQVGGPDFAHHVEHCLRYLRQSVLCCADSTLEEIDPRFVDGKWVYGASGTGMIHECRDWTAIRRYMSAHPAQGCGSETCI